MTLKSTIYKDPTSKDSKSAGTDATFDQPLSVRQERFSAVTDDVTSMTGRPSRSNLLICVGHRGRGIRLLVRAVVASALKKKDFPPGVVGIRY